MKKKRAAILIMLMLIMTGTVLAACSDKEPAEEPVVIRAAEGETVVIESAPGNEAYLEDGEYDLDRLIDLDKQQLVIKREELLDGFRSLKEGKGSSFVPDEEYITLYESKED